LRILLIIEIKSEIVDVQGLLGPLDTKVRVASSIAVERGLGRPALVVPVLIVGEAPTARRRIAALAPLFARFNLRGRNAMSWLRRPHGAPTGLLILSDLSSAASISTKRLGTQRVRARSGALSVGSGPSRLG